MKKPGKFTEPAESRASASNLDQELQRLRKAGLSDLAVRPRRYPALTEVFTAKAGPLPADLLGRLDMCASLFRAAVAALPTPGIRQAATILFHVDGKGVTPPLDLRRRAADRAFTGRGVGREPDTVRRYLERDVLDPMLGEVIASLAFDGIVDGSEVLDADAHVDLEAWADDLDRALISVTRQDFRQASALLDRWLRAGPVDALGEPGGHLRARSLMLLGDLRRDQGLITGPLSAEKAYRSALGLFDQLGSPRRIAQGELALALVAEMSGNLVAAVDRYRALADDDRLTPRDRARARLWVGTAVTKRGEYDLAVETIWAAMRELDELDELDEWAVGQQKLALAHLHAGRLADANRHIDVATRYRQPGSLLQGVRLDVAHAHILITDRRTRNSGLALLDRANKAATASGLGHQLQSMQRITAMAEEYERQERR